jgi:hypothetical protein
MTKQVVLATSSKSALAMAHAFVATGSTIVGERPQGVVVQHADGSVLVIKVS